MREYFVSLEKLISEDGVRSLHALGESSDRSMWRLGALVFRPIRSRISSSRPLSCERATDSSLGALGTPEAAPCRKNVVQKSAPRARRASRSWIYRLRTGAGSWASPWAGHPAQGAAVCQTSNGAPVASPQSRIL